MQVITYSVFKLLASWQMKTDLFFAQYKLLTPWLVRASISFSISGQCWGHSLFIISTMIRDRTSLMWLSSSRIERVPWEDQNRHQISVYDCFIWIIRQMFTLLTAYCYHTCIWQQLHGTLLQLDFLLLLHVVPSEPARKANFFFKYATFNFSYTWFVIVMFHSLDDVLQDLQTKVSHHSWLGFVG